MAFLNLNGSASGALSNAPDLNAPTYIQFGNGVLEAPDNYDPQNTPSDSATTAVGSPSPGVAATTATSGKTILILILTVAAIAGVVWWYEKKK
jgi:lysozyme family protein